MTNVSKNILESKTEVKLRHEFAKFFSDQTLEELDSLFSNILSPAEQTMLIKRLGIIVLLFEGQSTYSIGKTLLVSDSTVREIKIKLKLNHYEYIKKRYQNKKFDTKAFLNLLETLLNAGMPSLGKDRWKSLR